MKFNSEIFIPKINNKLDKIIKRLEFLDLINNKINIQIGGIGEKFTGYKLVNSIENLQKQYNERIEKYNSLILILQDELTILRTIIMKLLDSSKHKPLTLSDLVSESKKITKFEHPPTVLKDISPAKELSKAELPKQEISTINVFNIVFEYPEIIKIYNPTENNYEHISSLFAGADVLWSADIQTGSNRGGLYSASNINDIYIIHVIKSSVVIDRFLVSFKNNDLRDSKNNQLKLYELYEKIYNISPEAYTQLKVWFDKEIDEYINPQNTSNLDTKKTPSVTIDAYKADALVKYNIMYKKSVELKYTTLTIIETINKIGNTHISNIPFYINIYEFISKFKLLNIINIIGDFSKEFYNIKERSNILPDISILNISMLEQFLLLNIHTLSCMNVNFNKLPYILMIFFNLITITVKYTDKKYTDITNNELTVSDTQLIISGLITKVKTKKLKTINLSSIFTLYNLTRKFTDFENISPFLSNFERHKNKNSVTLNYID